jgi:PAS domain S-box-containing protein
MPGEQIMNGYAVGAVDYLIKPLVPEILLAKVTIFIELFRQKTLLKRQLDENRRLLENISQHQSVEASLLAQNEWFRTTLSSIGDAVIATDAEGRVVFLNPVAERLSGWTYAEALGKDLPDIFNIVDRRTGLPADNPSTRVLAEGIHVSLANHTLLIAKDGTHIPINDSGAPIRDDSGHTSGAVLVFRDVSEQQRAQQLQERLVAIIESSDDAIISKDFNAIITSWNTGAERMYGYTAEEAIGQPIDLLIPPDWPNDVPHILGRIRRGERLEHYETKRMTKDGRVLDVSLSVSPIHDADGTVIGASKIARDITERKQRERELARALEQEQQARAEAEHAVQSRDEFLSVAAHELKTPVTSLRGFAETMLRQLDRRQTLDPERIRLVLTRIDEQSKKLSSLISQLLDISRIQAGRLVLERRRMDVTTLVKEAITMAQDTTRTHTITLRAEPVGDITIDALRFEQVLINLLDNAIKYSPEGGDIAVEIMPVESEGICIAVTDHGLGVSPEHRPRLFERFYRGQQEGYFSGMGLGLYISRQIIELHGGQLLAEFPESGGTRFVIRLPAK